MLRIRGFLAIGAATCLLAGCSASTKTFYANRTAVKDTQLCRTFFEAAEAGNELYASDLATEATRRGLTLEECRKKVETENGVLSTSTRAFVQCP